MNRTARFGFVAVWVAVAVAALALHFFWRVNAGFLGVVETRTHLLGAGEAGRIRQVLVRPGDRVAADQPLVVLDSTDLEVERDWLVAALKGLEVSLEADRVRYALDFQRQRLQGDASRAGLVERRAERESRKAELASLNAQIERLSASERAGLGRARDLTDLLIRRDAAARFVREASAVPLADPADRKRDEVPQVSSDAEDVVRSMVGERLERISELTLRLTTVDERMGRRRILAPCDGQVVGLHALPGDAVDGFQPIVTVEEPAASFIDVYIPESTDLAPRPGQQVRVRPRRAGVGATRGTVISVDPGYSAVPERLAFRNIVNWARRFRVRLDEGHVLMPGEAARVEVLDEFFEVPAAAAAEKKTPSSTATDSVATLMQVPASILARGRFEPSGIAWLPDIERYLIASDDTGRGTSEHAPWLFLMDRQGQVEPEPIVLEGAASLNDVESIAQDPEGLLFLVSSQGASRKGVLPASRRQVFEVRRKGRSLRVVGELDLLDLLARSYDAAQLRALGLDDGAGGTLPALEIEAAAWHRGTLLLGLKHPRPASGALLWRLENPHRLFSDRVLRPGQLTLAARVDLRTEDGLPAAFSDLAVDPQDGVFALGTAAAGSASVQAGGLFRLVSPAPGDLQAFRIRSFPPGLKPEGLCALGDGRFTVVFDSDGEPPFPFLSMEQTAR